MTSPTPAANSITTPRLRLRCWLAGDANAVRAAIDASDAHLRPWVPFMKAEPPSLAGTQAWIAWRREQFAAGGNLCYGVFIPETGVLVGEVMLLSRAGPGALEIGYWIDVRHTGCGYATEAAAAMVWAGFTHHGCQHLLMLCDEANTQSSAIPRKLGFLHVETRDAERVGSLGGECRLQAWKLLSGDYPGSPAAALAFRVDA